MYVVAGIFMVFVIIHLLSVFKISSLKLMGGSIVPIQPDQIPAEQIDVLVAAEQTLLGQGFEYQRHVSRAPVLYGLDWGLYGVLYYHQLTNTWALCYVEQSKHTVLNWRTIYLSAFDDVYVATESGNEIRFDLSVIGFIVSDPKLYSPLKLWEYHFKSLKNFEDRRRKDKDVSEILEALEVVYFQGMVEVGDLKPHGDGYRLPFMQSRSALREISDTNKKLYTQKMESVKRGEIEEDVSGKGDYAAYLAYKKLNESNKSSWVIKTLFLLVSVLLFGLSFGLSLSFDFLLMLIVVLFIHEAGHLFGMWLFGYKDLRMLFVPFMGALASGKKDNVSAWQEAIVLLLGPMPGYVVGLALWFGGGDNMSPWLLQYAIISVFLNGFNLLPFIPLDGGRLVSIALFNRLPLFQLFLSILSIVAFVYFGIVWDEWVMLILAFFLLLGLPYLWKEIQVFSYLLKQKLDKGQVAKKQLFGLVAEHPIWKNLATQQKWPLIDSLAYRLQHANASVLVCFAIMFTWVSVIVVPLYVAVPSSVWSMAGMVAFSDASSLTIDDEIEKYEAAETDADRLKHAITISAWALSEDQQRGELYWAKAKAAISNTQITTSDKATSYEQMSALCNNYEDAGCEYSYTLNALQQYEQLGAYGNEAFISQAVRLAEFDGVDITENLSYLNKAEQLVIQNHSLDERLAEIYFVKGSIANREGKALLSEEYMVKSVNKALEYLSYSTTQYQRGLLNLYATSGNHDAAREKIQLWIDNKGYVVDEWTPLSNNILYVMSWRLVDLDPNAALQLLEKIEVSTSVDRIELILAKHLIGSVLGVDVEVDSEELKKFISSIESSYEWDALAHQTIAKDSSDLNTSEQDLIGATWYARLEDLIKTKDFTLVLDELETYRTAISGL